MQSRGFEANGSDEDVEIVDDALKMAQREKPFLLLKQIFRDLRA